MSTRELAKYSSELTYDQIPVEVREKASEKIARDLAPLIEIIAKVKVPIMFHTGWTQWAIPIYHGMPLFIDDLAERFPEVPFIITKMGRGYHFLLEMAIMVAFKHNNVYFDTVQTLPEHVQRAVSDIGADRIMFGTDWSATWRTAKMEADIYTRSLDIVNKSGISDSDKEWILGKTAAKLYGI